MNSSLEEKKFRIKEYKKFIDSDIKSQIVNLIKEGNPESILAKLSSNIVKSYIDILVRSNKLYLITYELKEEVIGYAILADKPKYLISEFKDIKNRILFNLIINFKFLTVLDIIFSLIKIDLIRLNNKNRRILNENLNLNLIAFKNSYRSKGYGAIFLKNVMEEFAKKGTYKIICCETYSNKAEEFYKKKLNFYPIGIKIRIKKNLTVLSKKLF